MKRFCIGIISYLPEEEEIRKVRLNRIKLLLREIDQKFKLPIIIVAQNWHDVEIEKLENSNLIVYSYNYKMGITNARIKLREIFLSLMFTHIILLDDDMELGSPIDCQAYIKLIENTNYDYYCIPEFLNNFSCLSRVGFTKVNYDPAISAEKGTGFEDWIFYNKCKGLLYYKEFNLKVYRKHRKEYLNDEYSTWDPTNTRLKSMNEAASKNIINKKDL